MGLTAEQWRLRSKNRTASIIAKIELTSRDIYICDTRESFLGMAEAVNPAIKAISGLGLGDFGKVSDIRLKLANKKMTSQGGNPFTSSHAIRFSDLIADGLDGAPITIKELVANVKSIEVTDFASSDLSLIFRGLIQEPIKYNDQTITVSATIEEQNADVQIPTKYIGEEGGRDPWAENKVLPIVLGDSRSESYGSVYHATFGSLEAIVNAAPVPVHIWDATRTTLVLSSHELEIIQAVTVKYGQLPTALIIPRNIILSQTAEGYRLCRIADTQYYDQWLGFFGAYFMSRSTREPFGTYTLDWEDIKDEGAFVEMSQGDTIGITTPQLIPGEYGGMEGTKVEHITACVRLELPEGAEVKMWVQEVEPWDGGENTLSRFVGTIRPADLRGSCYFTGDQWWYDFRHDSPWDNHKIGGWGYYGSKRALRIKLERIDAQPGTVRIHGIYTLPTFIIYEFPDEPNDETDFDFGVMASGIPTSAERPQNPSHPSGVMWKLLKEFLQVPDADLDIDTAYEHQGMQYWKIGNSIKQRINVTKLLAEIQNQTSLRLCRDPDGIYRTRMRSRFGGEPYTQRAFRTDPERTGYRLRWAEDFHDLQIERPSLSWVKNVIMVNYMPDAGGRFQRTAWVRGAASDDGYGWRSPGAEAVSQASITKYSPAAQEVERRLVLNAYWIRDRDTAVGMRDWLLSRYAEIPNILRFRAGHLGSQFLPGLIVWFDHSLLDAYVRLSGATWYGQYFEIEEATRRGDGYQVKAIQCPTAEVETLALVPRYFIRIP